MDSECSADSSTNNGGDSRGLPPLRWLTTAAATVIEIVLRPPTAEVVDDGGCDGGDQRRWWRGRGKREGSKVKMELTIRSHVQLGLIEIFNGKRDGVA
uniref:Uncharacterized protein n=1 Tax=Oryza punctata TaxID=4537 RepID=A0A0E0KMI7_ORYPU